MTHRLQVTTSPRSTWLWAATDADAAEVRALLNAGAHFWVPAYRHGREVARVTDVEIGATALEALEALTGAGWSLRWHPNQHPLNQRDTLLGFPVAPPE